MTQFQDALANTASQAFYVVSQDYVGPNRDENADAGMMIITTEAPLTNSSQEVKTSGWLGTTHDISAEAHGEFASLEEARAFVERYMDGEYREIEAYEIRDEDVVAAFRFGALPQLDRNTTIETAAYSDPDCGVTAETTNEEIEAIVEEFEAQIRTDTHSQIDNAALRDYLERRREILRDEAKEDAEPA